ncbi:hypothetical protein FRC10_001979 [Ceratobasidium sp. 414]|nr:hypothetical protein FRC10_001979 [Ceratobasidium sp. 414]
MTIWVHGRGKVGKDLSFRAWRQCTGWAIHNHKFLEDIQEALNNRPSITQLFKLAAGHILQCKGAELNHTSLWFSDGTLVFPEGDGEEEDLEGQMPMDMDKDQDKDEDEDEDEDDLDQLAATSPEAPAPAKDKQREGEQAGGSSNPKATVKSCKIIGADLDLQMDMEYEEQARAAQASTTAPAPPALPQQRPAPCPAWAKILTSVLRLPSGTVPVPQMRPELMVSSYISRSMHRTGERLAAEDIYELNLELVELDAKFLKEWQFAKEDIVQRVKAVRHTLCNAQDH